MKFIKKLPVESGYYYYVDVNYPAPMIGFYQSGILYELHGRTINVKEVKFIRFGDKIQLPECKTNKVY